MDLEAVFEFNPNGNRLTVYSGRFELDLARGRHRTFRKAVRKSGNHFNMFDGFVRSENCAQDHVATRYVTSGFAREAGWWFPGDLGLFVRSLDV